MRRLSDSAYRWLTWGLVAAIGIVYMRFANIFLNPFESSPPDDRWYLINNDLFFAEHWVVIGVLAVLVWIVTIAGNRGSVDGGQDRRTFAPAFVALALALLFWLWAFVLSIIDLTGSGFAF